MKKLLFLTALLLSIGSIAAHADLVNTTVNGTLVVAGGNLFTPASASISNTTTEFSYVSNFTYTADFTSTGLTISRTCSTPLTPRLCTASLVNPYTETFTDSAFAGATLTTLVNGLGLTNITLSGSTISFNGSDSTGVTTFGITPGATPEPGSIFLLGTGIIGLAGSMRRRLTA